MELRLLEKAFASQKIKSGHFYSCPPRKTITQVLIITPLAEGIYSFPKVEFFQNLFPSMDGILNDTLSYIHLQVNVFDIPSRLLRFNSFIEGLSYDQCISFINDLTLKLH